MAGTGSNRAQEVREQRWTDAFAQQSADAFGSAEQPVEVYQTSTMAALLDGIYDGDLTIAELLTHGDFGLGTFNHLDGEMVVLDGTCYHLHFLTQDRRHGGHALDFVLHHGEVTICTASELHPSLPRTAPFLSADLSPADTNAQIKQTEGG